MIAIRKWSVLMLMASRVLQLANGFLLSVALVTKFGLSAAGTYALATVGISVLSLVGGFGLQNSLPRGLLSNPERATAGLAITIALIVPCLLISMLYGILLGADTREATTMFAFVMTGFFMGQTNVLQMLCILQERTWGSLVPQIVAACSIVVGALASPDVLSFSIVVLIGRALSNMAGFAVLRFHRVGYVAIRDTAVHGSMFAPLDILGILSEQLPILIISTLMSRAELGLFGIIRQLITAADAPGWSYVQAKYPTLVTDFTATSVIVGPQNTYLSLGAASATFALTVVLALFVYRQPMLIAAILPLLIALPLRYINNFYDQAMRAVGMIRESYRLVLLKLALSLLLFWSLTAAFGFGGAISAFFLLSILAGLTYRHRMIISFPQHRSCVMQ